MLPIFADPKTDFVFKRIFGTEAHKHLLIELLNALLELEGDRRIVDLVHLTPEQSVPLAEMKLSVVDVVLHSPLAGPGPSGPGRERAYPPVVSPIGRVKPDLRSVLTVMFRFSSGVGFASLSQPAGWLLYYAHREAVDFQVVTRRRPLVPGRAFAARPE